jgi:hypothetical protein
LPKIFGILFAFLNACFTTAIGFDRRRVEAKSTPERNRERVDAASELFRRDGVHGVGLIDCSAIVPGDRKCKDGDGRSARGRKLSTRSRLPSTAPH